MNVPDNLRRLEVSGGGVPRLIATAATVPERQLFGRALRWSPGNVLYDIWMVQEAFLEESKDGIYVIVECRLPAKAKPRVE
jgi:hypothetical protein